MKKKKLDKNSPPKEPIPVKLTNRRAQFLCDPDIQVKLKPLFAYETPGARFSDAYTMGSWDGRYQMMRAGGVSAGLFLEMRAELEAQGWKFEVLDKRRRPRHRQLPPDPAARPYQTKAVRRMVKASRTGGIILVATGAGKTRLTGELFRQLTGGCLFCVDELTLLEQARRELAKVTGEEIGIVGRGEFDPQRITVATIQTLHRHRKQAEFIVWFRAIDVIVIDELHLALAKRNLDVVRTARPKACFGLTATLEWEKPQVRMPAAALCGPILYRYPMAQGVKEGYLSDGVAVCVQFADPLGGVAPGYRFRRGGETVQIWPGSAQADYRYRIALNGPRNALVEALAREGVLRKRRVVVLVERLSHARALSRRLKDVPHAVMSGAVKASERMIGKEALETGDLSLLIATRVFGKGIDIKTVDTIIDATGMPSRNWAQQRYGRGARKADTKEGLIYIDIADWGNRHAGAAFVREKALQELGVRVLRLDWKGDARAIYDTATACLSPQPRG